uniref:Uncharacterized protein n=1 Tax=Scophthalmus maximus TaxID=52904 RepID=A0A8D3ECY2_SCOMX
STVTQHSGHQWHKKCHYNLKVLCCNMLINSFVEVEHCWDPYETCHRRQFVYHPNSAAEILLCPGSTSFVDPHSQSGPLGSTVYNEEFCWKTACKPECIQTGTASGQRRNNPPEYVRFPLTCPPSEGDICKAMTTQYRSTYRCDFTGLPQDNASEHSSNLLFDPLCVAVPTVVQRQVHTKQKGSDVTTYDRFYGKRATNITSVVKSAAPGAAALTQNFTCGRSASLPVFKRFSILTICSVIFRAATSIIFTGDYFLH